MKPAAELAPSPLPSLGLLLRCRTWPAKMLLAVAHDFSGGLLVHKVEDEMGDVLFAAANLARKLDIDPEAALRRATAKFERRFRRVEMLAAQRGACADLDALEALWEQVKREEAEIEPVDRRPSQTG